ncbi:hypothetical protein CDL15_Pgr016812 [Punica granatum]|uniref:Uncharacterized protein n=1 Tax=Punica granatum TaxID=22663 RepID=A0A218WX21_PUNGR|nr:hypothetical protein CDL15_Pgr016812 [Punica granatum]
MLLVQKQSAGQRTPSNYNLGSELELRMVIAKVGWILLEDNDLDETYRGSKRTRSNYYHTPVHSSA